MKKKFVYEFDDTSKDEGLTIDQSDILKEHGGRYKFEVDDKKNINLFANKRGYMYLARLFIKLAEGDYSTDFHIHEPCDSSEIGELPRKHGEISIFIDNRK
jgi:hypothetical protein